MTDIDALIEQARRAEGIPGAYDLLGMVVSLADALEATAAELQNVSDIGDGDVQRLAESYSENLRLEAELRKERRDHAREIDGWQEAFDEVLMERDAYRERADDEHYQKNRQRNRRLEARDDLARAREVIESTLIRLRSMGGGYPREMVEDAIRDLATYDQSN